MYNIKKAAAEASTFFSRAKQFTEEKLIGAEKTVYNAEFENLLKKIDDTKNGTERVISNTETLLQPNPNDRLEDFLLTKLDKKSSKPNILETLGQSFAEYGHDIGSHTKYGNALIKVGEAEKQMGYAEKIFVQKCSDSFIQPLKSFLEGQMKMILKEKKILEAKRLDLDASKARLKKYREEKSQKISEAEDDVKKAQIEFDRQSELLKLLLEELNTAHDHHSQCLADFVEAQLAYHQSTVKTLQDIQKLFGNLRYPELMTPPAANGGTNGMAEVSHSKNNHEIQIPMTPIELPPVEKYRSEPVEKSSLNHNSSINRKTKTTGLKKAKVLFDFEAGDENELTVLSNEIVMVNISPNDNDWVYAERGSDYGRIPKAYIQIVD